VLEVATGARLDRHDLAGRVGRGLAVLAGEDPPAAVRGATRGRDVATETDEHAAFGRGRPSGSCRQVARERLAARTEIQFDAGRDPDGPGRRVEANDLPAGHRPELDMDGRVARDDPAEVVVVADDSHRSTDRRIDRAVGVARDGKGGRDRLPQERADPTAAGLHLETHELTVRAEPAVREVHIVEELLHCCTCRGEVAVEDQEVGVRPEGAPIGLLEHVYDEPVETCARPDDRETPLVEPPPTVLPYEFDGRRVVVEPPFVVDGLLLVPDRVPGIVSGSPPTGLDPTPA